MLRADIQALQQSSLKPFLFADVGLETNGMSLSVLSTLARFDLDPWQEAGRLALLSRATAIEALAALIKAMPASRWSLAEAVPIATRLVALLPSSHAIDADARPFTMSTGRSGSGVNGAEQVRLRANAFPSKFLWFTAIVVLSALFVGLAAGTYTSVGQAVGPREGQQGLGIPTAQSKVPIATPKISQAGERPPAAN